MNLAELEALFRAKTGDGKRPYGWSSVDVRTFLADAEEEACKRADLIREADDTTMCSVGVAALETTIVLDDAWTRISGARWLADGDDEENATALEIIVDRDVLDGRCETWRTREQPPGVLLIERGSARFDCLPDTAGTLLLEGWRLPGARMSADKDEPEIGRTHHPHLVDWAMHMAYSVPDSEQANATLAAAAEERFTRHFGERADRDNRQEHSAAAFNKAW